MFYIALLQVDRARKKECAVKVKVEKDYSFRDKIWDLVDYCCRTGTVPDCSLPTYTKKVRETKGKVMLLNLLLLFMRLILFLIPLIILIIP